MGNELALAPARGKQRPYDGALLLDGGVGEHHEDEGHDDDEQEQQDLPHDLVTRNIVGRKEGLLVGVAVDKVGDLRVILGEDIDCILLEGYAVDERHLAVVEHHDIAIGLALAGHLLELLVADHALGERDGVEHEVAVLLEGAGGVGEGHDAHHLHGLPVNDEHIAHLEPVVLAEDPVERDLAHRLREAPLRNDGLVELLSPVLEHAHLYADVAVVGGVRELDRHVAVELLVDGSAQVLDGPDGLVRGLEVGHEVEVGHVVALAHAPRHGLDGAGRHEEAGGKHDGKDEQSEHAQVATNVVPELARQALEERVSHDGTPTR